MNEIELLRSAARDAPGLNDTADLLSEIAEALGPVEALIAGLDNLQPSLDGRTLGSDGSIYISDLRALAALRRRILGEQ
jgi:hypothetical protein